MGVLNKIKNVFFEEEVVLQEEKRKKDKPVAKKIELPKQVPEEVIELEPEEVIEEKNYRDNTLLQTNADLAMYEEDDFLMTFENKVEEEVIRAYEKTTQEKTLYGGNTEIKTTYTKVEEKRFQPTPIISPVYGIVEKPQTQNVTTTKTTTVSSYETRDISLEEVRNKAFGDTFESLNLGLESLDKKDKDTGELEDNLLYDLEVVEDDTPKVEKVTLADAEEYFEDLGLEYDVDYKDVNKERTGGRRSVKEAPVKEVVPLDDLIEDLEEEVVEEVPLEDEVKETSDELDDNLFDLIDLMYEKED